VANTYLTNVDFSGKATEESLGAHIAYTFDFQGGAASGYNTPLLFKSDGSPDITFEKLEALTKMGEDVTELRKSYIQQVMDRISEKVREKFEAGWDWVYVIDADFDANVAIFCSDNGMFSVGFKVDGLNVEVEEVAKPVVRVTDYQVVDGDVMISIDFFEDVLDDALSNLVKSSLKQSQVKDYLVKAHAKANTNSVDAEANPAGDKSANTTGINKGETPLENINKEEFLKSAEFQELMKAQIAEAVEKAAADARAAAELEAQEKIAKAEQEAEELRKAEQARIEEEYTTVVKSYSFVEEDKVEALVKYLVDNKDIAETIVKAFEKARAEVDAVKKEFGAERGVDVINTQPVAKSSSELISQKAAELKKAQKQ